MWKVLLNLCFLLAHSGNFVKCSNVLQPKISFDQGCLLIEPATDQNISFRMKGSAKFLIGDFDLIGSIADRQKHFIPANKVPISVQIDMTANQVFGPNGLESRVQKLENSTRTSELQRAMALQRRLTRSVINLRRLESSLSMDNCKNDPCKNGGVCVNLYAQYRCLCPRNWQGETCEEDVNECEFFANGTLGCQNGGTCVNTIGSYRCLCPTGFYGLHCIDSYRCLSAPPEELCGFGTCVDANNTLGYDCLCNQGWEKSTVSGVHDAVMPCTVDIDECASEQSPCGSSMCINQPGSFRCGACPDGFTGNGYHCTDIDECLTNNGGCSLSPKVLCINTEGSYNCGSCPLGWFGDGRTCNKMDTNGCGENNPCHPQAACQVLSGTLVCTCPRGMAGDGYGMSGCRVYQANPCDPNPCKNGGTCIKVGTSYTCQCPDSSNNLVKYSPARNCEIQEDPCSSSPCLNGGTCVSNMTSATFSCVCPRALTGDFCTVDRRGCGRVLRTRTGVLKFPNMERYDSNERCAWVIQTVPGKVLNITFTSFDLEESVNCVFDWLQIHDGRSSASQIIGRFCGKHPPKGGTIISTHNVIYMWFRSDNSSSHKGFELSWTTINPMCGGTINIDMHGTIQSPGYPAATPPNRECEWILKAPFGKVINVAFYAVNFGMTNSCDAGFLAIYSGSSNAGELIAKYCNTTLPTPLRSPSHELVVHYVTDVQNTGSSFLLHYAVAEGVIGCGGRFTTSSGEFEAPQMNNRHSDSIDCEYFIQMPKNTFVKLTFMEFNLRGSNSSCGIEVVEVYEGNKDALVGRWCGSEIPSLYNSTSNSLLVRYISSGVLPSTFRAKYELGCGGVYSNATGAIKSPAFPDNYPRNLRCIYDIEAPEGYAVSLITISFNVRALKFPFGDGILSDGEDKCWTDSLSVYDGFTNAENCIGKYCSTKIPVRILSKTNQMTLVFVSKDMETGKGFSFVYNFLFAKCGGIIKAKEGIIENPVDDGDDMLGGEQICRWILQAPAGNSIIINIEKLHILSSEGCLENYLEIVDNSTLHSKLIERLCGENQSPYLMINSNLVTITYRSFKISDRFKISYKFSDGQYDCGGNLTAPVGILRSPGSQTEYSASRDCVWMLEAPIGSQIMLTVAKFDVEPSDACEFDFLEIRNGMSSTSPLIGVFCGGNIPKEIPSFANHLYLHFHSDTTHNFAGFEIKWEQLSSRCGGVLEAYEGIIESPHYPDLVTSAVKCKWHIIVNKGSTIRIRTKQIGSTDDICEKDNFQIYDGIVSDFNRIPANCTDGAEFTVETTTNQVTITFTSHSDGVVGGFVLNYSINCNHELRQSEGVIESPNFPNLYPNKIQCQWKIIGDKKQSVSLDVSHLDMERFTSNTDCRFDYLEVVDIKGYEELTRKKYCTTRPDRIISQGETVFINFHTDHYDKGSGFHLEYRIQGCGETLTKPVGEIESPNYPYALDVNCLWTIRTEVGYSIQLTVSLELNTHDNCASNSLQIATGNNGIHEVTRYCETTNVHVITVSQHEAYIRFKTDSLRVAKGFKISYQRIRSPCGGPLQALNGKIYSPNFPKAYANQLFCEWLLDFRKVEISFLTMDLESNCTNDYVAAYITGGDQPDKLIRQICGSSTPKFTVNIETGFQLKIVLKTNEAITKTGFSMEYRSVCYKDIVVDDQMGSLAKSRNQASCTYKLRNRDTSSKIILTVTEANCDATASVNPRDSYFTINLSSGPLQFCNNHPPPIFTDDSDVTIIVPSGTFVATYTALENTCGGVFTSLRGKIASPFYPNSYPVNVECIWSIQGRFGNSLEINFFDMFITKSEHCNEDYLEVRENNETGKLLGLYCDDILPTTIVSSSSIWMKFRSDETSVGKGFLAEYSYGVYNELNGTTGQIQSPPMGDENRIYKWRITAPLGNVIYLIVKEYEQGLQIFDGFDETANELTPDSATVELKSTTSVLFIQSIRNVLKPFLITWQVIPKSPRNETRHMSCGEEMLQLSPYNFIRLSSPGYPRGYAANLDCQWILQAQSGFHAVLLVEEMDLESTFSCVSDYVEVSSSTDLKEWKAEKKYCTAISNREWGVVHGAPYLKVNFHSDPVNNGTGFLALLKAACGGEMTTTQGTILSEQITYNVELTNCSWRIRVRPGRKIQFHLSVSGGEPRIVQDPYIYIKNGIDAHSPPLGIGRYSMRKNNQTIPITSSNRAFVYFNYHLVRIFSWVLSYKEVSEQCGEEFVLSNENDTVEITSPNYPDVPNPFSECTWVVRVPSTESINVTFIRKFDMSISKNCEKEYLEIYDGATSLSNLIGVYCTNPRRVHSTGNFIRLHYVTTLAEPRDGFAAIVGITKCGGTYNDFSGEITSLNYPKEGAYPANTVCEYWINLRGGYRVNITVLDVHLPYSNESSNNDYLVVYPVDNGKANLNFELARIYGNSNISTLDFGISQVLIKFVSYGVNTKYRGFRIIYRSMYGYCGAMYNNPSGEIRYPSSGALGQAKTCNWRILAPKGQQVTVLIASISANSNFSLDFYNDVRSYSLIDSISGNHTAPIRSTNNIMYIKLYSATGVTFNLKYSTGTISPCYVAHDEASRSIAPLPASIKSFSCEYSFTLSGKETLATQVSLQSAGQPRGNCFQTASVIFLMSAWLRVRSLCGSISKQVISLPFTNVAIHTRKTATSNVTFFLTYKRHQCGGLISNFSEAVTISKPMLDSNYGEVDCAWQVRISRDAMNNVSVRHNFQAECNEEYINLYADMLGNIKIKTICKEQQTFEYTFRRVFFATYHANRYSPESNFSIELVSSSSRCGGSIMNFPRLIELKSDDYKNNIECIWDLYYANGYQIGLEFVNRFFLEASPDCSKDFLEIFNVNETRGFDSKGRFCGRDNPGKLNDLGDRVRLLFRTDATNTGDGFSVKATVTCGGIFNVTHKIRSIQSPDSPLVMQHSLDCNYTLMAPKNQWINLRLTQVHLGTSSTCGRQFLTVFEYDSLSNVMKPINKVCKTLQPIEVRGREKMIVNFQCDQFSLFRTFRFEYSLDTCGGIIQKPSFIQSPTGKDNKYPNEMDCIWNITAPAGKITVFSFIYFELESSHQCMADFVQIYPTEQPDSLESKKLCGKLTDRFSILKSRSPNTTFYAHSDTFTNELGFAAYVSFTDDCDTRHFLTEDNFTLISQEGSQQDTIHCQKSFSAPEGFQLQIEFEQFDLKMCANCTCDRVEIRDGDQFGDLLGRYCGNSLPSKLTSSDNNLTVSYSLTSLESGRRIRARVTAVQSICGKHEIFLNASRPFTLKSPDSNGLYPPNTVCLWKFTAERLSVHLHFDRFEMQASVGDNNECRDYLEITDSYKTHELREKYLQGPAPQFEKYVFNKKMKFCGNQTPSDYFGMFSPIVLKFKSDSTIQHSGFQITARSIDACTANFTEFGGRIYGAAEKCVFYIIAPQNYTLSLYSSGYWESGWGNIKLYDGNTGARINGSLTNPVFADTNVVQVVVNATMFLYYDITYWSTNAGLGCGGKIHGTSGQFSSPLWPSAPRNATSCRWDIQSPQNQKISLTFSMFDMGAKINCATDYVQILEYDVRGEAKVVRKFCGGDTPAVYTSVTNRIAVLYEKSVHFDGIGWTASFLTLN